MRIIAGPPSRLKPSGPPNACHAGDVLLSHGGNDRAVSCLLDVPTADWGSLVGAPSNVGILHRYFEPDAIG
jgi:hypothetical protein